MLDRLGWLQFEQLASRVLEADGGLGELSWRGRAYRDRVGLVHESVVMSGTGLRVEAPFVVAVAWVRDRLSLSQRQAELASQVARSVSDLGLGSKDRVVVVTNLDRRAAEDALTGSLHPLRRFGVLGRDQLSESIDRYPGLRLAMPS